MAAIAAIIAAGALSAGSGYLGSQAQNKAGQRSFNQTLDMGERQQQNLMNLLYGSAAPNVNKMGGRWEADGRFHTGFQEGVQYAPGAGAGASIWDQGGPGGMGNQGMGGGNFNVNPAGNGVLARMAGLGTMFGQQSDNIMGQYDQSTQNLLKMLQGSEGMANQWGQGREKIIRDDSATSLKNSNRMADAALVSGGFNSPTIRANQFSENATRGESEMQRNLQALSEAQIDRQMGARRDTNQFAIGRSAEGTGLRLNALQQKMGYAAAPLQTELQAGMSSIMNPWLGNNMSSYNPGQSALGSALGSGGNFLGALGGYGLGRRNGMNDGQGNPPRWSEEYWNR